MNEVSALYIAELFNISKIQNVFLSNIEEMGIYIKKFPQLTMETFQF